MLFQINHINHRMIFDYQQVTKFKIMEVVAIIVKEIVMHLVKTKILVAWYPVAEETCRNIKDL